MLIFGSCVLVSNVAVGEVKQVTNNDYFIDDIESVLAEKIHENIVVGNYSELKKNFQDEIAKDIPVGYMGLAYLYKNGLGVEVNSEKAKELYVIAVNHPKSAPDIISGSLYELGKIYYSESNYPKAIEYYESTLSEINSDNYAKSLASFELATIYLKGNGVPQDVAKAIELLEISDRYDPNSSTSDALGKIFYEQKNYKLAEKYLIYSAINGNGYAQKLLGNIYDLGLNGTKNKELATKYFNAACSRNIYEACLKMEK